MRDALLDEGFSKADLAPVKQVQNYLNSKKVKFHFFLDADDEGINEQKQLCEGKPKLATLTGLSPILIFDKSNGDVSKEKSIFNQSTF